ncbi:MAG: hypothetical protein M3680_21135 [Myxococcota bacterium]|nr:hypothetical protein [Myxococcota bacterium]
MTHELGSATRALLDAARGGLAPDAAALARVRLKIDASIGGAGAGAGVGAAAGGGLGSGAIAAKLAIVAIVAAVATSAVVVRQDGEAPQPTVPALELRELAPVMARGVGGDREQRTARESEPAPTSGVASPPQSARVTSTRDHRVEARPLRAVIVGGPVITLGAPVSAKPIALAREVALVDTAMASLHQDQPEAALAAVRMHAVETAGRGQLAEDAAAIEVEALCRLHDRSAITKLEAFDARWPASAQRARLAKACP